MHHHVGARAECARPRVRAAGLRARRQAVPVLSNALLDRLPDRTAAAAGRRCPLGRRSCRCLLFLKRHRGRLHIRRSRFLCRHLQQHSFLLPCVHKQRDRGAAAACRVVIIPRAAPQVPVAPRAAARPHAGGHSVDPRQLCAYLAVPHSTQRQDRTPRRGSRRPPPLGGRLRSKGRRLLAAPRRDQACRLSARRASRVARHHM
mmetsp:Transcript_7929/g.19569  ORF Transcript_7929/g.19569 Transcript_7929/m.19569 type:complete len:203 (-) Transcript_7929:831-1439(-)